MWRKLTPSQPVPRHFSKDSDTTSHRIVLQKSDAHGLDRSTMSYIKDCSIFQAQRVVLNGVISSWCLLTSQFNKAQSYSISLSMPWMRGGNAPSASLQIKPSWAGVLQGRKTLQRDLDRPDRWPKANCMSAE